MAEQGQKRMRTIEQLTDSGEIVQHQVEVDETTTYNDIQAKLLPEHVMVKQLNDPDFKGIARLLDFVILDGKGKLFYMNKTADGKHASEQGYYTITKTVVFKAPENIEQK